MITSKPPCSLTTTVADARSSDLSTRLVGGRYRATHRIGVGGTAEVWEARDEVLTRPVALKRLHPHLAGDPDVVGRFRREAMIAARLQHPGIVAAYDTCDDDGVPVLVLELVRGRTVHDVIRLGVPPLLATARIGRTAAEALDHIHRKGIHHGDLKPSNVMVADDGRVLLSDLGAARVVEGTDLTVPDHSAAGTARYLAPEQLTGSEGDARSDLYSLGLVLFELVCGRHPFDGDTEAAAAVSRLHREPMRAREVRADVPRRVDDILARCLRREPEDRYPDAATLVRALSDLEADLGPAELSSVDATSSAMRPPSVGPSPVLDPPTPTGGDAPGVRETKRRWLLPAALIALAIGSLVLAGVLVASTEAGRELFDATRDAVVGGGSEPVPLIGVATFDPQGDRSEHDVEAESAIDGNPATAWRTERYRSADLGTKDGVGLILRLSDAGPLDQIRLLTRTGGWAASVYVDASVPPTLAGWGNPVARINAGTEDSTVALNGARGQAVLVWFTRLASSGTGYTVEVEEVSLTASR